MQVLKRPTLLFDAIKKLSLKALFLPDRSRSPLTRCCRKQRSAGQKDMK